MVVGISGFGDGISGFIDLTGMSGYSGFSGASGYSGFSGISGYSGSGISGFSGYSGISGWSGAQGISGYSGVTPSISSYSNYLSSDVTLTNDDQFYDGPSITLQAGTYFLQGSVRVVRGGSGVYQYFNAKLWNGTSVLSQEDIQLTSDQHAFPNFPFVLSGLITISSQETWKISVAVNTGTGAPRPKINAAVGYQSAGNYASYLNAIKIG